MNRLVLAVWKVAALRKSVSPGRRRGKVGLLFMEFEKREPGARGESDC
jgi:hypothetical protein